MYGFCRYYHKYINICEKEVKIWLLMLKSSAKGIIANRQ